MVFNNLFLIYSASLKTIIAKKLSTKLISLLNTYNKLFFFYILLLGKTIHIETANNKLNFLQKSDFMTVYFL
jgi:hypothetical protein